MSIINICTKTMLSISNMIKLFIYSMKVIIIMGKLNMKYIKIMRDLRECNDMTQKHVAEMLGTSQTMYARYERGANELPVRHLIKLCKFYGVSADCFLGLKNRSDCAEHHGKKLRNTHQTDRMHKNEKKQKKGVDKGVQDMV